MQFVEHDLLIRYPYQRQHDRLLVDVGAHRGTFSKPFALQGWRVIAFEPEPGNYEQFVAAFRDYEQVVCIPKGISDVPSADTPFYVSAVHPGIHSLQPFHDTHNPAHAIETVRLDTTLTEQGVTHVTILKIDIEGADFLALKSFDFAQIQPELVICEFMDDRSLEHFGYTHHDMVAYMHERGYCAFVAEWEPIKAYGRPGVASSHTFLQCVRYPLDHQPAWGNLIFVPHKQATQFEATLKHYLAEQKHAQQKKHFQERFIQPVKQLVKRGLPKTNLFWYAYARIRNTFLAFIRQ
jgi:FkbM family methyltransferase